MRGLEFSAPYNNDTETLEELISLKDYNGSSIREIYLSGPQQYSGSGRVTPEIDLQSLIDTITRIHSAGIRVNLLMNSTCEGINWYSEETFNNKMEYIRLLHEEYGVETITVANPLYLRQIRKRFPDIEICASVLGDIDCVQKALIYRKAGADVITPEVSINRDLPLLKDIKEATGAELKLMVNEGCMYKCPFRKFHFNYTSHQSLETTPESNLFFADCQAIISADYSQILKSCWIRPEDIEKYGGITSYFKIVGRGKSKNHVLRTVKAYAEQNWQGDLLDLLCASLNMFTLENGVYLDNKALDKYNFFEKVTTCGHDCTRCSYCADIAAQEIRTGIMTREKLEDFGMERVADRLQAKGKLVGNGGMKL
ncbi:MAG: hypothetical protein JW954_07965 [Dehalococcoidaceae bacterium]|nr:hypothetical protein [Dehalococcoidaceae bacterium]